MERYRNAPSRSLHGFITRDGVHPAELRRIAREELRAYPDVTIRETEVLSAQRVGKRLAVQSASGEREECRKLLIATGLVDRVPALPGLSALLGVCAFHCPYCDGWELRDQPLIAYGEGNQGAALALELTLWTRDVSLCTGGRSLPEGAHRTRLEHFGIGVHAQAIARVEQAPEQQIPRAVRGWLRAGAARALLQRGHRTGLAVGSAAGGGVHCQRRRGSGQAGEDVGGGRVRRGRCFARCAAGGGGRRRGSKAAIAINTALLKEELWGDGPSEGATR